ncbi:MAG: ABC transporter permease [Bacillati bacterium ANGP1]|uniref:ABC transporter permease n=1 Tax=Candidatus Segetimicrobium genomatis TaxID=2569760 RepID=A0A537JN67_9BACT|nr:MAG: ABC transporter permease [Terrabacteria group bacterium ANGP1]
MIDDAHAVTATALPRWRPPIRRLRLPLAMWAGAAMLAAILFAATFAPLLTRYDPVKTDLGSSLQPPSAAHPLGTDNFGRDILTRLLYGARVDLQIGLVPTAAAFFLGLIIGSAAGYYGGAVDGVLMRIVDVSMAFPFYVLVIAIVAMLGPGLRNMYVAMILAGWVTYARVIRGEILAAKGLEYILGARALGASDLRVIRRHLLPNVVTVGVIFAMSDAVLNILLGGALSFLGLGVQPPTPEWGLMIAEGRDFLLTSPAMVMFPGLALLWVGVTFNILGDTLTDRFRPGG